MLKKIFAIQMMYSALAEKADKKLTVYADAAYHIYYISLIDILYCNKLSVTYCELWDYKVPYWPFGELHSNAGPDKETVSANWNYTKESASQSELHPSHIPMFSWDQVTTNLPPPAEGSTD